MKKYILGGIATLVIAIVVAININLNSERNARLSAIFLANIEVLASGESSSCDNCVKSCAGYLPNGYPCCGCCTTTEGSAICDVNGCRCA
jgi:hypothetical protein